MSVWYSGTSATDPRTSTPQYASTVAKDLCRRVPLNRSARQSLPLNRTRDGGPASRCGTGRREPGFRFLSGCAPSSRARLRGSELGR